MRIRTTTLTLSLISALSSFSVAQISVVIDPPPVSTILENFNDGIDTTTAFSNASSAGEAGGVISVAVAADAPDPQFQVPTPGDPFDIVGHPFFRLSSRGTVGAAAQVFPLPPSGVTVVGFNTGTNFAESPMTFVADPPGASGTGLRSTRSPTVALPPIPLNTTTSSSTSSRPLASRSMIGTTATRDSTSWETATSSMFRSARPQAP